MPASANRISETSFYCPPIWSYNPPTTRPSPKYRIASWTGPSRTLARTVEGASPSSNRTRLASTSPTNQSIAARAVSTAVDRWRCRTHRRPCVRELSLGGDCNIGGREFSWSVAFDIMFVTGACSKKVFSFILEYIHTFIRPYIDLAAFRVSTFRPVLDMA